MKDNPEKVMLFVFPMITFSLFLLALIGWWALQTYVLAP